MGFVFARFCVQMYSPSKAVGDEALHDEAELMLFFRICNECEEGHDVCPGCLRFACQCPCPMAGVEEADVFHCKRRTSTRGREGEGGGAMGEDEDGGGEERGWGEGAATLEKNLLKK